ATGASTSSVDLLIGRARVFVSRFWSGRPEIRVNTPTAVVGVKGSEVGIEGFTDGSTLGTVITGSAWVEAKAGAGAKRGVTAGNQLRTTAAGRFQGDVITVNQGEIADLRTKTDPDPVAPRELPPKRPLELAPGETSGGTRTAAGPRKGTLIAGQTAGPS